MRLSILLYMLKVKLIRTAKRNPSFLALLKKRNYTVGIRTEDCSVGRYFTLIDGNLISKKGSHKNPDIELIWKDAGYAFNTLSKNDDLLVLQALGKSQLRLEGNLEWFFWFSETLNRMMSS